jgi:hypothetical protein
VECSRGRLFDSHSFIVLGLTICPIGRCLRIRRRPSQRRGPCMNLSGESRVALWQH